MCRRSRRLPRGEFTNGGGGAAERACFTPPSTPVKTATGVPAVGTFESRLRDTTGCGGPVGSLGWPDRCRFGVRGRLGCFEYTRNDQRNHESGFGFD